MNGVRLRAGVGRVALCLLTIVPLIRWTVVVHAVPAGDPWRHECPRCSTPLRPDRNIVAVSPRARCGICSLRLGPPPWTVEIVTAVSAVALALSGLSGLPLAAYGWWAAVGIALTFVDLVVQRLPTRLCYAATGGFLLLIGIDAALASSWGDWTRSALGGLIAAVAVAACVIATPKLVHWGDVRYALAVGAAASYVGWLGLYAAVLLSTLMATVVGLALVATRRATLATHLPLGPFLYAGTLATVVVQPLT